MDFSIADAYQIELEKLNDCLNIAKHVSLWVADLFSAASVVADHPIHKFPMDAWASCAGRRDAGYAEAGYFQGGDEDIRRWKSLVPP